MKPYILLTSLTLSILTVRAQNLINQQVSFNNVQTNVNYTFNNLDINENNTGNRGRGSSTFNNPGNSGNNTNPQVKVVQVQQKTNKPKNKINSNPVNEVNVNRGNVFDVNDNVNDVNVQSVTITHVKSNPVIINNNKKVADKPVVKEYEGLDFKPSGLSGRDYSNGGKLKKGEKNINKPTYTKHKPVHRKRPSFKKVKYHTAKCAKW